MITQNSNGISFKGKHFYVGFDVHKKGGWLPSVTMDYV